MVGENRQSVTDEPVEFGKQPVEVQDCRKITDYFRGIYRIIPQFNEGKPEDVDIEPAGLANTRISTDYGQKSSRSLNQMSTLDWVLMTVY